MALGLDAETKPHALCYNPCWLYADSKLAVNDTLGSSDAQENTGVRLATGEKCSASPNLALDSVGTTLHERYRNTGLWVDMSSIDCLFFSIFPSHFVSTEDTYV